MKVMLFGAGGQVGSDCAQALLDAGYEVYALTREDADFAKVQSAANKVDELKPDIVINACAYTAVDKAEDEKELADLVNHQSVAEMASACEGLAIPLIHLSTDYIFDGTSKQAYSEDDKVNPLGVYGATKLAGEKAIQLNSSRYIILRTSWVFGEHGNNFVKTMLRLAATRNELKVVDDQFGRPSYVGDIVAVILFFVARYQADKSLPWGVYHCCSEGQTSWYGFAQTIFELASESGLIGSKPAVLPIPSIEYPTPAPRPACSVLSTDKLSGVMGTSLPHWREGLLKFLRHKKLNVR
jgi:dTDP-4-dehydrorhamnose reductase